MKNVFKIHTEEYRETMAVPQITLMIQINGCAMENGGDNAR
jgi:hypothetical protein